MGDRIEVSKVSLRLGGTQVLNEVSFEVEEGTIAGIVGLSGSGKTSILEVISGLKRPSSGSVKLNGRDLAGVPPGKRGIGTLVQGNVQYPQFKVRDDIALGGKYAGLSLQETYRKVENIAQRMEIGYLLDRTSDDTLSGGEKRRVSLARTLIADPSTVLLDEPLSGLDKVIQLKLGEFMLAMFRERGTTVLLVTHDLAEAFSVANRVIVIDGGTIKQIGTPQEILDRPEKSVVQGFVDAFRSEHDAVAHLLR